VKPTYLSVDTVDDRREVWHLLHRLPPDHRVAFLQWACKQVPPTNANRLPEPAVWKMRATADLARRCDRADNALTNECYSDILQLAATWGLDLVKTAHALERLVRALRV